MKNFALILGAEMRSGTNYLYDLLGQHQQISLASHIPETFWFPRVIVLISM